MMAAMVPVFILEIVLIIITTVVMARPVYEWELA